PWRRSQDADRVPSDGARSDGRIRSFRASAHDRAARRERLRADARHLRHRYHAGRSPSRARAVSARPDRRLHARLQSHHRGQPAACADGLFRALPIALYRAGARRSCRRRLCHSRSDLPPLARGSGPRCRSRAARGHSLPPDGRLFRRPAERRYFVTGSPRRTGKGGRQGSSRRLSVKVKSAGKRSVSSTRWLERQLNDPYVAEAKRLGYRSRAAFKLAELDDRLHLLKPGTRIVDLGAAPGGWTQIAVERARTSDGRGQVVALDLLPMQPIAGAEILEMDFLDSGAPERIRSALGGPADLVMSDMAAPSTGHAQTDHLRIMALAEAAYAF